MVTKLRLGAFWGVFVKYPASTKIETPHWLSLSLSLLTATKSSFSTKCLTNASFGIISSNDISSVVDAIFAFGLLISHFTAERENTKNVLIIVLRGGNSRKNIFIILTIIFHRRKVEFGYEERILQNWANLEVFIPDLKLLSFVKTLALDHALSSAFHQKFLKRMCWLWGR